MLFTPLNVTRIMRTLLVALALAAPGWLMTAYWRPAGADGVLISLAAHVAGAYGLTLLTFAALPRMRRGDLTFALIAVSAAAGLARTAGGAVFDVFGLLAVTAGVGMAYLPGAVERLRALARTRARETFAAIKASDPRQKVPALATQQRLRS